MASTPPPYEPDPGSRWTGRARVSGPAVPTAQAARPSVYGAPPAPVVPPPRRTPTTRRRIRPRWGRIALVALALLVLVTGVGLLTSLLWFKNVDDGLRREDPFAALEGRPPKLVDGTVNILMLGSDSRDPDSPDFEGGPARADTIAILHIPATHDRAYMVSIPRDLWVDVPPSPDGQNGDTRAKINAAYAWGGLPLMVQTVEGFTGVRLDHVALIDFGGFVDVTNALGGVDMVVDQSIVSIHEPFRTFEAGPRHFNGEEALDYVRQRYQYPDGDFTRMRHQQEFLKALMDKAVGGGTLTNVGRLRAFVTSIADSLTVDKDFSLVDLAWQFHELRTENITFLISPNVGPDDIDGQSVVRSDSVNAKAFYEAMANDTLANWLAQHPTPSVGG